MFLLHGLFPIKFVNTNIQYFFGVMRNKVQKQPLEVFCKKKLFLKISQNPQENACARASF